MRRILRPSVVIAGVLAVAVVVAMAIAQCRKMSADGAKMCLGETLGRPEERSEETVVTISAGPTGAEEVDRVEALT